MVDPWTRLGAIREAGEVALEALDIGFRPAANEYDPGDTLLEEDPKYGPCLEALKNALDGFAPVDVAEFPEAPSVRRLASYRTADEETFCGLVVLYRADGTGSILVSVKTATGEIFPIHGEEFELSPLQVGRNIAQAELAILVAELGSCAEALDYWVTDEVNYQHRKDDSAPSEAWHKSRGVTRQAISNNVNSARKKLEQKKDC